MGKRRRAERTRLLRLIGIGSATALALVAGGLAVVAAIKPAPPVPDAVASYTPPPASNPEPSQTPKPEQRRLADVVPRLAEDDRDFTIVVFGDSTGVSAQGWQVLVPRWLGQEYDRPVTLHPWDRDAEEYAQQWDIQRDGVNAPITVWNASSPGRDVQFARDHQDAMVPIDPEDVDLVFMNFGHTEKSGAAVKNVASFTRDAAELYSNAAVVYLKQNPDHSRSPLISIQKANVYQLEQWATENNFDSIPVYDAFVATGRVDELMDEPTLIHPNDAGYRVWAVAMIERLKADGA